MEKKWEWLLSPNTEEVDQLTSALKINRILCQLLVQRGIKSYDEARDFFRPSLNMLHDPFEMKGMHKAVDRLTDAIFKEERILVYGDYDVDGTTSVALMYNFLIPLSSNIFTYIPDRYTEGYGVSEKGIEWAVEHDIDLIICLDCGIRANDTIGQAREHGIDVIICDHHLPGEELPDALTILDPKQSDCTYPYDELSGCGIGFKLIQGFCIQNGIEDSKLYEFLDLVCVSIASDIVPITGENRVLAFFGLKKLNASPTPGLAAMIKKAGLTTPLSISDVVFGIGPRINAAGRINHAKTALDLLTQKTEEDGYVYAEKLNLENAERKSYDENITREALELIREYQVNNHSSVVYQDDWHKGVIGIVASRCIERYYKPTIVLTESNGKVVGSARSVNGFDIHDAISKCSEHLIQFGGHKHAAGLTLEKKQLTSFSRAFETVVAETIDSEQKIAKVLIDLELNLDQIDFSFLNILNQMGPFGPKNMQPVFCTRGVQVKGDPRLLKEKHLKLTVEQATNGSVFEAIGFGLGRFHNKLDQKFDIAYTIEENRFRGETTIQLNLKDIRIETNSSGST